MTDSQARIVDAQIGEVIDALKEKIAAGVAALHAVLIKGLASRQNLWKRSLGRYRLQVAIAKMIAQENGPAETISLDQAFSSQCSSQEILALVRFSATYVLKC
jgi:hypothetical protein